MIEKQGLFVVIKKGEQMKDRGLFEEFIVPQSPPNKFWEPSPSFELKKKKKPKLKGFFWKVKKD